MLLGRVKYLLLIRRHIRFSKQLCTSSPFCKDASKHIARSDRYTSQHYEQAKRRRVNTANHLLERLPEEKQELLRRVQIEYEVMKAEGFVEVPERMTSEDWFTVLLEDSQTGRARVYQSILAEEKCFEKWKSYESATEDEMKIFFKETCQCLIFENTYLFVDEYLYNWRQKLVNLFKDYEGYRIGHGFVFDINYLRDLRCILERNRIHLEPSKFFLTNLKSVKNWKTSWKEVEDLQNDFPFLVCYDDSVADVFPVEELVVLDYLSNNSIEDYMDRITVVSWKYDLKAESHLMGAKLPVTKYIKFLDGTKPSYLSLLQKVGMLQDFHTSNNWPESFTNNLLLPKHKYYKMGSLAKYVLDERQKHKKGFMKNIKVDLNKL